MFEPELEKERRKILRWIGLPLLDPRKMPIGFMCMDLHANHRVAFDWMLPMSQAVASLLSDTPPEPSPLSTRGTGALFHEADRDLWDKALSNSQMVEEAALQLLGSSLVQRTGASSYLISALREGVFQTVAFYGFPTVAAAELQRAVPAALDCASTESLRRRAPVVVPDRFCCERRYRPLHEKPLSKRLGALIAVPLLNEDCIIGTLELYFARRRAVEDLGVVDWAVSLAHEGASLLSRFLSYSPRQQEYDRC